MNNLIEWHKTGRTVETISGPCCQMITERMNADLSDIDNTYSFCHYARYNTSVNNGPVTFEIQEDSYYWLFAFRAFWPLNRNNEEINSVYFRILQNERGRKITDREIPFSIYTTPAQYQPARYRVDVNQPFLPGSIFMFYVNFDPANIPDYVDIMTEGIRIPSNLKTRF